MFINKSVKNQLKIKLFIERIGRFFMSKIQIITDSASDISKETEQKYNLDVISYSIVIGDKTYTSRVDFDNEGVMS